MQRTIMESNLEVVKKLYTAIKSGDGKVISQIFQAEIVWEKMEVFPHGGTRIGTSTVFEKVFDIFTMYWNNWGSVPEQFDASGNKVFVTGYYHGVSIESGKEMHAPLIHVYTLKGGLINHFKQYMDTHLIQRALVND